MPMPSSPAKVCVLGPSGRMGRSILDAAMGRTDVQIVAAVDRADANIMGTIVSPGVIAGTELNAGIASCDVYIDFTSPGATLAAARAATKIRRAAVIGTTGLDAEAEAHVAALAAVAPIVVAANFSLGVNLLLGLVGRAARALPGWDAEIVETHHKAKRDAPSGTALALAHAMAAGRGQALADVLCTVRDGEVGPRPPGQIGVVALRGGDVVGEHHAFLFGDGERIELAHLATSRRVFADGALVAAAWVVRQPPGRYDMQDVLGLRA